MSKSCKGLATELVKCLSESDCVKVENRPFRECANQKSPSISSECVGLRETYFNCKRGQNQSEIESLCKTMNSQGLRIYIVSHLSNVSTLRREAPAALKLSLNPPKLALECFSRFSLVGTANVFNPKDSSAIMIKEREASLLVLELFLLMSDGNRVNVEASVKEETDSIVVV